jgi:cytochrome P450 family 144
VGCVERALSNRNVDFMADIGNVVPITMISRLIGFRGSDLDLLLRAAFDSTAALGAMLSLEDLHELVARIGEVQAWIADQLATAVQQPGDDILGSIARGIDAGAFGDQEGINILHTLLSAGGESTTSLLGNAVRLLAEHPDLQEQLRQDPQLIPTFVEEALRLESPFRCHMRTALVDAVLGTVDIPAGSTVLMMWGAANRDPAEFECSDQVDLERRVPRRHVAFGRGIHFCVGAPLARLELRIALPLLLERLPGLRRADDEPLAYDPIFFARGLARLRLRWDV